MSDESATEYVTIRGGDHPRETARALLDAAAELALPARRVQTKNVLGRAVFVVPVQIADQADARLREIHAHADDLNAADSTETTDAGAVDDAEAPTDAGGTAAPETTEDEAGGAADSTETTDAGAVDDAEAPTDAGGTAAPETTEDEAGGAADSTETTDAG